MFFLRPVSIIAVLVWLDSNRELGSAIRRLSGRWCEGIDDNVAMGDRVQTAIVGTQLSWQPVLMSGRGESDRDASERRRLRAATVTGAALHFLWIAFWWWYLKMPGSVLCTPNPEPGGFNLVFEACPEARPRAGWVVGFIPFVGPILSFLTATLVFRFPLYESRTWTRFLFAVPIYSILILLGLLIWFLAIVIGVAVAS